MNIKIDFHSKRVKLALRFFSYGVMTVVIVVLTAILVFYAMGYRLGNNLQFYQGGLIQFNTFPNGADVYVDGAKQNFQTPNNATLTAGRHYIVMSSNGYDAWAKSIALAPGQLLWLSYARLIPSRIITTNDPHEYKNLTASLASKDRHWIILEPDGKQPSFVLVDLSNTSQLKFTTLTLPDAVLNKTNNQYGTFSLVEWDSSSRYFLVKEQNGSATSFIRVNPSDPTKSINLTSLFALPIEEAHFSGANPDQIFVNTNGVLRRLDVSNNSATDVLVSGLEQFKVLGDHVAYVGQGLTGAGSQSEQSRVVGIWQNGVNTAVRELSSNTQVLLAYGSYENHDYLAIADNASSKVDILRDPGTNLSKDATAIFGQLDLGVVPRYLSFSPSYRMLLAQNDATFATFDFETFTSASSKLNIGSGPVNNLNWLDDFYLWNDTGGQYRLLEFDGTNEHDITTVQAGQAATLSSDGKTLYSIGANQANNQSHLQISPLVING